MTYRPNSNSAPKGLRARDLSSKPTTFFSSHERTLDTEDKIELTSVGVDIGSATSHLVFSKILMERRDTIYVVSSREILFESDVLLTPYRDDRTIDAARLQSFFNGQYERAGIHIDDIDAGALILTGVAVRRRNARAIGELFAEHAGKFVAVSAGDSLEAALIAYGSGAVAESDRESNTVMNVDIGGGTSKIAVCAGGEIIDRTAIDVGARLICFDNAGRVSAIEEAGQSFADELGFQLKIGDALDTRDVDAIVERMAERLFQAMGRSPIDATTRRLLRLDPLQLTANSKVLIFSGGVSEYIYGKDVGQFGDLGPRLAAAVQSRVAEIDVEVREPLERIRATVIGASQYTVQVSGSTIFVMPDATLPQKNVAVISPDLPLSEEILDPDAIATAIEGALIRQDLRGGSQPVALYYRWLGSATFRRLDDFCRGTLQGLSPLVANSLPIVLVTDCDLGGLIGLHCHEQLGLQNPIVSIDGIVVREFDFIDIGAILDSSGVAPVVIKSLVFPAGTA